MSEEGGRYPDGRTRNVLNAMQLSRVDDSDQGRQMVRGCGPIFPRAAKKPADSLMALGFDHCVVAISALHLLDTI
jgi:hypothetical protein